jgi:hypothetical protein
VYILVEQKPVASSRFTDADNGPQIWKLMGIGLYLNTQPRKTTRSVPPDWELTEHITTSRRKKEKGMLRNFKQDFGLGRILWSNGIIKLRTGSGGGNEVFYIDQLPEYEMKSDVSGTVSVIVISN